MDIYNWSYSKHQSIKDSERMEFLVKDYLIKKKHLSFMFKNIKTPFAEVDLLLQNQSCIFMVEVKKYNSIGLSFYRVSRKQRDRLKRAYLYFCKHYPKKTVLPFLALVEHEGRHEYKIYWTPLFEDVSSGTSYY